jgi:hypothetical protein
MALILSLLMRILLVSWCTIPLTQRTIYNMLMMNNLSGFGAVATKLPASSSFLVSVQDTSDQTTYTYNGVNFGADDPTRRIIVVVHWSTTNAARNINSGTIGGIGMTNHILTQTGPGGAAVSDWGSQIVSAQVPTGSSGTVTFTLNGAVARSEIAVYRQINEIDATHTDVQGDTSVSGNALSVTVNTPAVGMVYSGASMSIASGASSTWVGVTEQYDHSLELAGILTTGGFDTGQVANATRTVSATSNMVSSRGALSAMTWK